jgi:hypothetical protein
VPGVRRRAKTGGASPTLRHRHRGGRLPKFTGSANDIDFFMKGRTMKSSNETLPKTFEGWAKHYVASGSTPARAQRLAKIHEELASLAGRVFASKAKTLSAVAIYAKRRQAAARR